MAHNNNKGVLSGHWRTFFSSSHNCLCFIAMQIFISNNECQIYNSRLGKSAHMVHCICVFVYLCICVFVYLHICWICICWNVKCAEYGGWFGKCAPTEHWKASCSSFRKFSLAQLLGGANPLQRCWCRVIARNTQILIQIHRCRYKYKDTNKKTQIQIHKFSYLTSIAPAEADKSEISSLNSCRCGVCLESSNVPYVAQNQWNFHCRFTFNPEWDFVKSDLNHKKNISDKMLFPCDICENTFKIKYELKAHHTIHSDEKPFCCIHCGKKIQEKAKPHSSRKSPHRRETIYMQSMWCII